MSLIHHTRIKRPHGATISAGAGLSLLSATVQSTAGTINLVFSQVVSVGAGGPQGVALSMSGGTASAEYYSGNNTSTLTYSIDRSIGSAETGTLSYTQPGSGIVAAAGGAALSSVSGFSVTNSSAGLPVYEGVLTISAGGTYNYTDRNFKNTSTAAGTAAVLVNAVATVTFTNCRFDSMTDCLRCFNGSTLTFVNCVGFNRNPNVFGQSRGRFLNCGGSTGMDLSVTNCTVNGTVYCNTGTFDSVNFLYNKANNISGLQSDGAGSYRIQSTYNDFNEFRQMIQFNNSTINSGCNVKWNQLTNLPDESCPGDGVNVSSSSGTASFPITIEDNYLEGSWGFPAASIAPNCAGIQTEVPSSASTNRCRYLEIHNNQVVRWKNIGIAAGFYGENDFNITGNRMISSGKLNGANLPTSGNEWSMYCYTSATNSAAPIVWNNNARALVTGGAVKNGFQFTSGEPGGIVTSTNWSELPTATEATEAAERVTWYLKYIAAGKVIGSSLAP